MTHTDPLELVIDTRAAMERAAGKPLPYTDAELARVIADCVEFVGERFIDQKPVVAFAEPSIREQHAEWLARKRRDLEERHGPDRAAEILKFSTCWAPNSHAFAEMYDD